MVRRSHTHRCACLHNTQDLPPRHISLICMGSAWPSALPIARVLSGFAPAIACPQPSDAARAAAEAHGPPHALQPP
eukprot:4934969-Prymnesium_polylepis.1